MSTEERLTFRTGDAVAIGGTILTALVLLICFLLTAGGDGQMKVRIYREGQLIQEMPLEQDSEYTVRGTYSNRVIVRGGKVSVAESDCPGENCVHSGWISRPGRSVVCLPNRVEVRVTGAEDTDDVDAVVR